MEAIRLENITIDRLSSFNYNTNNEIEVFVLRLDKIHPLISGNKWFKLLYYLEDAVAQNKKDIVTYGGAWSNHIVATAALCQQNGFSSHGIIRGEQPTQLSATLTLASGMGMNFHYIDRAAYKNHYLPEKLRELYIIPEGGYGIPGAAGSSIIANYIGNEFTHVCLACGTGTTIAGLVNALPSHQKVIGVSVMKNNDSLTNEIDQLLTTTNSYDLIHEYHFGGYAKYDHQLIQFMNHLYAGSAIPTDFVYTGKLFFAIRDLLSKNYFPARSKLLLIHTGGLQGNLSLTNGTLIF